MALDKNIQQFMLPYALISLTENIGKNLDEANIGCDIFVDLLAFDTVERDILLSKLEHYGTCGHANDLFKSYLSNRKQHFSINGYNSNLVAVKFGALEGSALGPLLFLIYINLNQALRFCKVYHFADDTNLIHFSKYVYRPNMLTLI